MAKHTDPDEKTKQDERIINILSESIARNGINIRRERLASGHYYLVKSGKCAFSKLSEKEQILFVDRRLSSEQQLSVLLDFIVARKLQLHSTELELLPQAQQRLFINLRDTATDAA